MPSLLRFSGARAKDPAVASWLDERPGELGSIARRWFVQMQRCGTDVRELVHDGCPVACVEDAPFGYVNAFHGHVNVGFFHGAALTDPARLLQGTGESMRHVKLRPGLVVKGASLEALITAAYLHIGVRLKLAKQDSSSYGSGVTNMKTTLAGELRDGEQCVVVAGTHTGKSGTVRDIKTSKTGHVTITVEQKDGVRFKTLARNVVVQAQRGHDCIARGSSAW